MVEEYLSQLKSLTFKWLMRKMDLFFQDAL